MLKQGDLVTIDIENISVDGKGIGRIEQHKIFIPDTVTGDRISARIIKVKKKYTLAKIDEIITPSPHRIRPRCIVADKCGGCEWQHIDYQFQQQIKQNQVTESLTRTGIFDNFNTEKIITDQDLGYRNKVNYPLGVSETGNIKAGYYQKGTHKIVNLNQCPIQDQRLNPLLAEIKADLQQLNIPIYNENNYTGFLRHLCFRIGRKTGEILITIVSTQGDNEVLEKQAYKWLEKYQDVVGVCLNCQNNKSNMIFGKETNLLAGRLYVREIFADLTFHLRPDTFFQINTETAEILFNKVVEKLNLQGTEKVIDLYCGIGTFTLPLAQKVKEIIGVESQKASIEQAKFNAEINDITNVKFKSGKVEDILPELTFDADLVIIDPPRKGCQPEVIANLLEIQPQKIVYISCHPGSLARDLQLLCQDNQYQLDFVQPADFFPQTAHVEIAVILSKV